jgi:hypothetical protein
MCRSRRFVTCLIGGVPRDLGSFGLFSSRAPREGPRYAVRSVATVSSSLCGLLLATMMPAAARVASPPGAFFRSRLPSHGCALLTAGQVQTVIPIVDDMSENNSTTEGKPRAFCVWSKASGPGLVVSVSNGPSKSSLAPAERGLRAAERRGDYLGGRIRSVSGIGDLAFLTADRISTRITVYARGLLFYVDYFDLTAPAGPGATQQAAVIRLARIVLRHL